MQNWWMMSNEAIFLSIIAFLGTVAGPALAYLANKRKISGEVLLTDLETIKRWREQLRSLEQEIDAKRDQISSLESQLYDEKALHRKKMESLMDDLVDCQDKLDELEQNTL